MTVAVVSLTCAVGFLTLLVFGLLRTHADIIRALSRAGITLDDGTVSHTTNTSIGPRGGEAVQPGMGGVRDIVGTKPGGMPTKVSVTGVDRLTLLAFLSAGCHTCEKFWEAFAEPDFRPLQDRTRLVIVGQRAPYESEPVFFELVPAGVKAVLSSAAWRDYDVPGSPYFALVDGTHDRLVGAGTAAGWEQMEGILRRALSAYYSGRGTGLRGRSSGRERARRADEALLMADIGPGHPSVDPAGKRDPTSPSADGDRNEA